MIWLEKKYLSMAVPYLDKAKWKNDNTLNHRCPYCGDSSKNKIKARGYHFSGGDSFIYKCHNCGMSTSSINFLKDNFPNLHREYRKEWMKENGRTPKERKMPSVNVFKFTPVKKSKLEELTEDAWSNAVSRNYLTERKISEKIHLRYVENSQILTQLSPKYSDRVFGNDPRVVIPFFDEKGDLLGVSGRAINDSPLRYLTVRIVEDKPLIYNLDKVDKSKKIYVTEGPIDSFFLENSIAVGGSDFTKIPSEIKERAVIIYDNEPRNDVILKKIEHVIEEGYSVCIWNRKRVGNSKDINDMIKSGLDGDEITSIIDSCTYSGLQAKAKLMEYKRI